MDARNKKIVRVSVLGILANLLLAGFKVFVGIISNSLAIILDAVNNFSDTLSSIITIIGAHFSSKAPDKNHPMGHGRAEYLSTVIIAMIIMYIGITALTESVHKIIVPAEVNYRVETVAVVIVAIIVKILLGLYVRQRGKKLDSGSLVGSGLDALYDAVISTMTLIAIIVFFATGLQVEAYLAAGISLFIIYSGFKLIRNAFSIIIGERASSVITRKIKADIAKIDGVNDAFDLLMHDYGSGTTLASVNIEIDHKLRAGDIDEISRKIQKTIYKKYHVTISSVGIYAINLDNQAVEKLWRQVDEIRDRYEHIINIHGFRVDFEDKEISFDVIVDFVANRHAYYQKFCDEVQASILNYKINVLLDSDISD